MPVDVAGAAVQSSARIDRPSLLRDASFWGLMATQFLGAFNDNLFKQLVLLIAVNRALENRADNFQGVAMFAFAAPFVLLSGVCGVLADRHGKRSIIVLSKVLEIVAMILGAVAFQWGELWPLMVVLFLMGAQSALFGPAKYGILPEIFPKEDLPRANGWMMMTTFVAIILGVALAGQLMTWLDGQLWWTSLACIGTAIVGTATSLRIARTPVAQPGLPIRWDSIFVPRETRQLLRRETTLSRMLVVTAVFWCVGGIYQQGVNDLGILQLRISEAQTGLLSAVAAIGIALGCAAAGKLSYGRFEGSLVNLGQWGMFAMLVLLGLPGPNYGETLLGVFGSGVGLIVLGASAGFFTVPITVYLQAMTPVGQRGQVIGVMNLCNWIGILTSALIHLAVSRLLAWSAWPANFIFLAGALILLPLVVWHRPRSVSFSTTNEEQPN